MDLARFSEYWFGRFEDLNLWFYAGEACDSEVERFRGLFEAVVDGAIAPTTPVETLLCIILLDQVPRHLFRGRGEAYAYDDRALVLARRLGEKGWHTRLTPWQFIFWIVVFEHREDLAEHAFARRCLAERLAATAPGDDRRALEHALLYLDKHSEVVRTFGRYPIRAAIRGLPLTDAEEDYVARRVGKPY